MIWKYFYSFHNFHHNEHLGLICHINWSKVQMKSTMLHTNKSSFLNLSSNTEQMLNYLLQECKKQSPFARYCELGPKARTRLLQSAPVCPINLGAVSSPVWLNVAKFHHFCNIIMIARLSILTMTREDLMQTDNLHKCYNFHKV